MTVEAMSSLPLQAGGALAAAAGHDEDVLCAALGATGARVFGLPTG